MEREATDRVTGVLQQQLRAHGGPLMIWLTVLALHGFALLALPPSRSSRAPPGKPMQLFWIPSEKAAPQQHPAAASPAPARRVVDGPHSEAAAPPAEHTARPWVAHDRRGPATPDVLGQRLGVDALLRQVPALTQPVRSGTETTGFDGGRGQIRLPGSDATLMPGVVVREEVSLDQRVQGVLAVVGLGRIDPCPDIRRHVRSAVEVQDLDALYHWVKREQRCR